MGRIVLGGKVGQKCDRRGAVVVDWLISLTAVSNVVMTHHEVPTS